MLLELLLIDVVSGSIGGGLEKQTGATGLLLPKRLFIGALLELMRSVRSVSFSGLLTSPTLMKQGLVLQKRMLVSARFFTLTLVIVDA